MIGTAVMEELKYDFLFIALKFLNHQNFLNIKIFRKFGIIGKTTWTGISRQKDILGKKRIKGEKINMEI